MALITGVPGDYQLQAAAITTGTGTVVPCTGLRVAYLEVFATGTFTLDFESNASNPNNTGGSTYYTVQATCVGSSTPANVGQTLTSITAPGLYKVSVEGMFNLRANVTAVSGGNVSVNGRFLN